MTARTLAWAEISLAALALVVAIALATLRMSTTLVMAWVLIAGYGVTVGILTLRGAGR